MVSDAADAVGGCGLFSPAKKREVVPSGRNSVGTPVINSAGGGV